MTGAEAYFAGLSLGSLAYALAVVFLAALVRGYSGFGLSALIVTALALVLPPAEVVPMALLLEIAASIGMTRQVWHSVAWRETGVLLFGACLGMPLGLALLAALPANVTRVVISLLILGASLALWYGLRFRGPSGRGPIFGTGVVAGLANGLAAMGGLPLVLYFLSQSTNPAVARATLIIFQMFLGIYGSGVAAVNGLVSFEILLRAGLFCVPLAFGIALGNRRFLGASPETFRRFALVLLVILSLAGLLRAALG